MSTYCLGVGLNPLAKALPFGFILDGWRAGISLVRQDKGIRDEKRSGVGGEGDGDGDGGGDGEKERDGEGEVVSAVASRTLGTFSMRRGEGVGFGSVCLKS